VIKQFVKDLRREFAGYNASRFSMDAMAGLTVTAVALPLALAFGVSCGADAGAGLITAIIAGLLIGGLSGASYQISGPTGAMTAVLLTLGVRYGLQGIFIAGALSGLIMILASFLKAGKLISFIPGPVVTGFTSGIAVVIALGQLDNFFGTHSAGENALEKIASYARLGFSSSLYTVLTGALVILVMLVWPRSWQAKFPSSLAGIMAALAVSSALGFPVPSVGTIPRTLVPANRLRLETIPWGSLAQYISPAVSIAALGMIESLLCGASAGRMKNEKLNADRELLAQGIGNLALPFLGGVPATAAIARTSVAIKSGGQTRLVSIIHSLGLLASMFLLGPVMADIPLSALAGVLLVTAWRMNEWSAIREIFSRGHRVAMLQFLVTMAATVLFDLTVAILIGVAASIIVFTLNSCRHLDVEIKNDDGGARVRLSGPLFFGTQQRLSDAMEGLEGLGTVTVDLTHVHYTDDSALLHLHETAKTLEKKGMNVSFTGHNQVVRRHFDRHGLN
jgi:sulfate permease, SulP family